MSLLQSPPREVFYKLEQLLKVQGQLDRIMRHLVMTRFEPDSMRIVDEAYLAVLIEKSRVFIAEKKRKRDLSQPH